MTCGAGWLGDWGLDYGAAVTNEMLDFWKQTLKGAYKGDDGRKRARMAVVCLLERDGLLMRLGDVKCPVWWMQVCFLPWFGITNGQLLE
jgi:hypothetical protein